MTQAPAPSFVPPKAAPAFASFGHRAAAFLIDLAILWFVGYTIEMAARGFALAMGPYFPLLTSACAFVYFWLGNGPLGKGTTIGKALLNLHVVRADGSALGAAESLRRASLQTFILLMACVDFLKDAFGLPVSAAFYAGDVVVAISTTILITLAYGLLLNPRRQGWHDLWAGSFVTRDPTPESFRRTLGAPPDEAMAIRIRTNMKVSVVFCVCVAAVMLSRVVVNATDRKLNQQIALADELRKTVRVEGYALEAAFPAPDLTEAEFEARYRASAERFLKADSGFTSATLRKELRDDADRSIFVFIRSRGESSKRDMEDPKRREAIESLRAAYASMEKAGRFKTGGRPPSRLFAVQFADQFKFSILPPLFKAAYDHAWVAEGPGDPAAGPLEYKWKGSPPQSGRH